MLIFFYLFFYKDNIAGTSSETTRRQSRRVVSKERRRGDRKVLFRPEEFRFMTISPSSIKEKCPNRLFNPRFKLNNKSNCKKHMFINLTGRSCIFLGKYRKLKGTHKKIQGGGSPPPLHPLVFSYVFL